MKKNVLKIIIILCLILMVISIYFDYNGNYNNRVVNNITSSVVITNNIDINYKKENYYNGEKIEDIITKINKVFNSSLESMADYVVRYSIEVGVDPYFSSAVILHETGCEWTCSYLSRVCNNYGGNKGTPSCNGGSYKSFETKEEGLKFAIDKLAYFYSLGLTTAEEIGPSYAESSYWPTRVNNYISKLKNQSLE